MTILGYIFIAVVALATVWLLVSIAHEFRSQSWNLSPSGSPPEAGMDDFTDDRPLRVVREAIPAHTWQDYADKRYLKQIGAKS